MLARVKKKKERRHRALFDDELPFQPKVEPSKKQYKRRPKHKEVCYNGENE